MSKDLHVLPVLPLVPGQKWNKGASCLTLDKAGKFTVTIPDFEKYFDSIYSKPEPFTPVKEEVFNNMTRDSKDEYKKKFARYNEAEDAYEKDMAVERANVQWAWQIVHKGIDPDKITHNNSFSKGISVLNRKQITFPKLLEGGGLSWLEIFTNNNPPEGKPPHGMFIRALGTPKIISAEWRDYTGKLITEEIAYGSTVYLHIYTEALYEQKIEIQLRDTKFFNADLTPTPSDEDGDPVQKLEANPLTRFTRAVGVHKYNANTKPPGGTITDALITDKGKEQVSNANVQKCVFPVFIEKAWQFQGGNNLSINPIVYHSKIEDGKIDLDDCVLKVSQDGVLMQGELTGNNPLMLGEPDNGDAPEEQKKVDFTFGVFIDGTNNNRYNTTSRIKWEEKRIGGKNAESNTYSNEQHLKVYAKSKKDVGKDENYKYQEGSYENDLSNVALLFDNYVEDKKTRTFKIYTEGMNTNTLGNEDPKLIKYEDDDYFMGGAFGAGNSGIVDRVRRTIEQLRDKILLGLANESSKKISSITIDVFGFSRGAAAARHFVHEITLPSYYTEVNRDRYGRNIDAKYARTRMPSNGHLGFLFTEEGIEFEQLIIRFAGIYDTVAHHGLVQFNDIKDLGLNSISKAKYVIHMVAGEEHRKNFSLSPIVKSQNHVEMYLPGVHCDVGGSYTEGRPEGIAPNVPPDPAGDHILATDYCDNTFTSSRLSQFRNTLIDEGWFTPDQIGVRDAFNKPYKYDSSRSSLYDTQQLVTQRAYISNQYSFIPLHMMCNLAIEKGAKFNLIKLKDSKDFKKNIFPEHLTFINKIKANLEDYAAKVMENPLEVIEHEITKADMRQLRNHYLHYNATTGMVNSPEPERKRGIVKR
jgi:hypothetical protein